MLVFLPVMFVNVHCTDERYQRDDEWADAVRRLERCC